MDGDFGQRQVCSPLVIYVDDIIIISNNNREVEYFIQYLCIKFKCKDLGIYKILQMEVIHNQHVSIDMNQT